ncbi:exopolysaccharide biosynthesis protein [Geomesophilobacter sediminis]|uniref:Exopolysaccharide biosynthesis protein n=1 Tax=Geomesophilobacter sediminis TaxID=2798584 RepID=A0A8J7JDY0_9BACT|nr:exopolysaccharide biosynthesis protein [Geomesophilobacter sediminis]MBJ6725511.1 exopolysaccharide biosynthesis protein [Geomesophilobacter sediminis]
MRYDLTNLEQVLRRIEESTATADRVSLGIIVEEVGGRSFGTLLVIAGVLMTSPFSGIPGMPTMLGTLVLLIALQLLLRRDHFWLPQFILKRSVSASMLLKAVAWLHRPARLIDRWLRPRLLVFTRHTSRCTIAILCLVIAATMPMMELVPFSVHGAGIALTAFGLSLIARDGLLALLAFIITAATLLGIGYSLLG